MSGKEADIEALQQERTNCFDEVDSVSSVHSNISKACIFAEVDSNTVLSHSGANGDLKELNSERDPPEISNLTQPCEKDGEDVSDVKDCDGNLFSSKESSSELCHKTRSGSLHFDSNAKSKVRRKCVSESEAFDMQSRLSIKDQEIEDAIGKYVQKLIRSSILKAVRSVSVDDIKEELLNEISNGSSSESSDSAIDFVVEQRLASDSVSELVELTEESVNDRVKRSTCKGVAKSKRKCDENLDAASCALLEGYQADNEETNTDDIKPVGSSEVQVEGSETTDVEKETLSYVEETDDEIRLIQLDSPEVQGISTGMVSENAPTQRKDLITMSSDDLPSLTASESAGTGTGSDRCEAHENTTETKKPPDEMTVNWRVGYLHVKLPHKSRGKTSLKVWKKKRVVIQPDEFVNDPKFPSVVISIYGSDKRKHSALFWQNVSSRSAIVYRSSSRTHRYAFTVSEDNKAVVHLSADSETVTQEWMAAIRNILWPPSPFMQLEKMLSGREFEISMIDNEFSFRAGLLGMYGYLTITTKKLILLHPQEGYVIQEWYLNTVDKFQLVPQPHSDDARKVLSMTTCSDSSTGEGEILIYCNEAVTLLQSLAATIHEVLSFHSKQEGGGKYKKELEEIADWLTSPPQDSLKEDENDYKVPPRQVKSLLDIPNFIFSKTMSPVASAVSLPQEADMIQPMDSTTRNITTSNDSGISTTMAEDYLNCSRASFRLGGDTPLTGKSSDSELSDTYTPPRSPEIVKKSENQEPLVGSEIEIS